MMTCYSHVKSILDKITKEDALKELPKLRRYFNQIHDSEGFDVDVCPKIGVPPHGIAPLSLTEKQLQKYKDLAELALETFNKVTDYEVTKVVKVNVILGGWDHYYLTFTAKDVSPHGRYRSPKTFQAKVFVPAYEPEIPAEAKFCRIKPRN